jgi:hypothetical protein
MDEDKDRNEFDSRVGLIQPHEDQLLYKVMRVEDLLMSISGKYLHFNRVDSYSDFIGADIHNGQQLPKDQSANETMKFLNSPMFSASDYYNRCRARTYACCFSVENKNHIWIQYGKGGKKGKVCLIFKFGKLRSILNKTLQAGNSVVKYNGVYLKQIFSVHYGLINYIVRETHQGNINKSLNPIMYTYFKDKVNFEKDKEFRIALSAFGFGQFALNDGRIMEFPAHFHFDFDFKAAIADSTIQKILCSPDCDLSFLYSELQGLGIDQKKENV